MQNSLVMTAGRVRLAAVSNFRSSSRCLVTMATRAMSTEAASKTSDTPNMENYNFETLKVTQLKDFVLHVELNRPEKRNAMNTAFWREMVECFQTISTDKDCRAVVVSGAGKMFTSGIDLIDAAGILAGDAEDDISRKATKLHGIIQSFQQSFTSIEKCPKPVIAAVHSACIGGGVDLISACDIRYCTQDAWFQIKEVDIGMAADVGTLQRLPKIVGNDSLVRELTYTARRMMSDEAQQCGLVSRTFPDKESMVTGALETAALIASKSPVAVQGSKINLVYSRDHSVDESLHYIAAWNQCMLQSEDLVKAVTAVMEKTPPVFSKL